MTNCILWGGVPHEIYTNTGNPGITYSDIQGGTCESWFGEGCIDADPLFVDPDGPDDDPATWEDNDYRLGAIGEIFSPCVDAGDNTAVTCDWFDLDNDGDTSERSPFDLDGNPRFVEVPYAENVGIADPPVYRYIVDMGAYEYQFCFGDLNGDDEINIADLAELLGHYGDSGVDYTAGDLDDDGDVDIQDLAELLGLYGTECS